MRSIVELARAVYPALSAGDEDTLAELLHPDFEATFTDSLPFGIGGVHRGAEATQRQAWWAIGNAFAVRAAPREWIECTDGRLLVIGRYVGHARSSGSALDAAFAHLWSARQGRLGGLWQLTDSKRWWEATSGAPGAPG
jgi:ketosteroid isomerase-like protein